jgi:hypothetical protein
MSVKELKCPKCGAPVSSDRNVCDYCKAQYIVVEEEKAILFGEYMECDTFKRLQSLKEKAKSRQENRANIAVKVLKLLSPCKVCHIKNCPFFNKDLSDIVPPLFY